MTWGSVNFAQRWLVEMPLGNRRNKNEGNVLLLFSKFISEPVLPYFYLRKEANENFYLSVCTVATSAVIITHLYTYVHYPEVAYLVGC